MKKFTVCLYVALIYKCPPPSDIFTHTALSVSCLIACVHVCMSICVKLKMTLKPMMRLNQSFRTGFSLTAENGA